MIVFRYCKSVLDVQFEMSQPHNKNNMGGTQSWCEFLGCTLLTTVPSFYIVFKHYLKDQTDVGHLQVCLLMDMTMN